MKKLIFLTHIIFLSFNLNAQENNYVYNGIKNLKAKIGYNEENDIPKAKNCNELLQSGITESGNYEIYPISDSEPYTVYCDMKNLGGGWTLVAYHANGISKTIRENQLDNSNYGVIPDNIWGTLRDSFSEGMMFIDENKLINANCYNIFNTNSLFNNNFIYHHENSGCSSIGYDYNYIRLSNNRSDNVQLYNFSNQPFDIWNYNATYTNGLHNKLYYFIK